jgi:hypothetical protein
VFLGARCKPCFPVNSQIDLFGRNRPLLGDSVRDHRLPFAVKEVEDAVVDSLKSYAKLINAVSQKVGLGSAQLVSQVFETLELCQALDLGFRDERIKPLHNRYGPIVFGEKDDSRLRHLSVPCL